jgi:signal peptidase I
MSKIHGLKGTWLQALAGFAIPLLVILFIRWAVIEPYVIPSGSMIPSLLIHDHILVWKSSFGLRLPFTNTWLIKWSEPKRGQVIVFKYPENPSVFYIKRLVGLPGDRVAIENGKIFINDEAAEISAFERSLPPGVEIDEDFQIFQEKLSGIEHLIRISHSTLSQSSHAKTEWIIPENKYFFVGDNRDQSSDSRVWGTVSDELLIGRAWSIWLSCDQMLESARFICDPSHLRWNRMLRQIK